MSELDQRIQLIPLATDTPNSFGESVEAYGDPFPAWAKAEAIDGSDEMRAETFMSHLTMRFWVRYRVAVTSSYRVTWRGGTYNIAEVKPIGRKVWLELLCSEAK